MDTPIPERMRALLLTQDGFTKTAPSGPTLESLDPYLTYGEAPTPSPGPGQALVKMRLANVNPSDIHFIKGEYGLPRTAGDAAGFEGCGDVVAAGQGAEPLLGKRVSFVAVKGAGGLWADFALADAQAAAPVPDTLRDEDAAALFVNPLTAIGMVAITTAAESGSVVITAAASQLGKLMIGLARDKGLRTIAVIRRADQAAALRALGADHVLVSSEPSFAADAATLCRAEKPRILLDAVADDVSAGLFFAMPSRARWIVYGLLDVAPTRLSQIGQLIFMDKKIEGFWLTTWLARLDDTARRAAFAEVFQRFDSGAWTTDVRRKIRLSEARGTLPVETGRANTGKVMLTP